MDYRLYLVRCGRFQGVREIHSDTDEQASEQAAILRGSEAAELWSRGRLVRIFEPIEVRRANKG